jgi:hypothetical protein
VLVHGVAPQPGKVRGRLGGRWMPAWLDELIIEELGKNAMRSDPRPPPCREGV